MSKIVLLLRYLLGYTFIPSGLTKIIGQIYGNEHRQSGFYWNFLGWGADLCCFTPYDSTICYIGKSVLLFIISNISVITLSLHFKGTWGITLFMFFASGCLLLWDLHKLQYLFYKDNFTGRPLNNTLLTYSAVWVISGAILFILSIAFCFVTSNNSFGSFNKLGVFAVVVLIIVVTTVLIDRKVERTNAVSKLNTATS